MKLLTRLLYVMTVAVLLFGCATTSKVIQTCEATATQAQQILNALGSSAVPAVAVAAVDALKFGCAVAGEIDAYILAHQDDAGAREMADVDPMDARRLANAVAWRKAHP